VATNANTAWSSRVFSSDGTTNRTAGGVFYARGNKGSQSFVGRPCPRGAILDTMVAVNGRGTLLIRSGARALLDHLVDRVTA
jgi:hypothetical protein